MNRKKRWHDQRPEMAQAVHFLSSLPDDLQTILGNTVIAIADKEFKVHDLLTAFKSLGHEKVLGLHQSKKKRRSYDQNPTMHKAINCIYVLPEDQQQWLSNQLLVLMKYVIKYFESHKKYGVPATADTLKMLTQAFVNGGAAEAEKTLASITSTLSLQRVARKTHDMAITQQESAIPKKTSQP
jgi:predicted Zn-dependent protease with MMP-like domain